MFDVWKRRWDGVCVLLVFGVSSFGDEAVNRDMGSLRPRGVQLVSARGTRSCIIVSKRKSQCLLNLFRLERGNGFSIADVEVFASQELDW